MPVPSAYTEDTFAAFLLSEARGVAKALGWATKADIAEVINETILAYGDSVVDVAQAADIRKVRIIGRYYLWKAAVEQLAGKMAVSIGGQSWNRDTLQRQAIEAFRLAKDAASVYIADIDTKIETASESISVAYIGPSRKDPYRSAL